MPTLLLIADTVRTWCRCRRLWAAAEEARIEAPLEFAPEPVTEPEPLPTRVPGLMLQLYPPPSARAEYEGRHHIGARPGTEAQRMRWAAEDFERLVRVSWHTGELLKLQVEALQIETDATRGAA